MFFFFNLLQQHHAGSVPEQEKARPHRNVLLLVLVEDSSAFKRFVLYAPVELAQIVLERNNCMIHAQVVVSSHRLEMNPFRDEEMAKGDVINQIVSQRLLLL
jgi:hypothetical protein